MRSLIVFVVPMLLSFNLIACASDDSSNEPSHDVVTNPLVQDGESCTKNTDCESNLCTFKLATGGVTTKGMPAPCTGNGCGNGQPPPSDGDDDVDPAPTPAPAPSPTPVTKGKPGPTPDPAPAPAPAPTSGICASR